MKLHVSQQWIMQLEFTVTDSYIIRKASILAVKIVLSIVD